MKFIHPLAIVVLLVTVWPVVAGAEAHEPWVAPSSLLAVDEHRAAIVDAILRTWHDELAREFGADVATHEASLRDALLALRADRLLSASLAGSSAGIALALGNPLPDEAAANHVKSLGDAGTDVTYVPVTPCRLVETRTSFAAVYHGAGAFTPNQVRTYTVHGGNGVCLTQLPATLHPAAVQLQVFGIPTSSVSGDIEILPQGSTFGSTATMVYSASLPINTVSTAARVNTANDQISVQVRSGSAHVAIDVVGYFAAPTGTGGQYFRQGGNTFGAGAKIGTLDNQPLDLYVNNQRAIHAEPTAYTPHIINGYTGNGVYANLIGVTIAGGGAVGAQDVPPPTNTFECKYAFGCINGVLDSFGTIGGGAGNLAGAGTTGVDGQLATVAGGSSNWAYAAMSTIAGGYDNVASGFGSTVGGGFFSRATATGATVPGGIRNAADGVGSFAAGVNAKATGAGQFTWADNSTDNTFDPGALSQGWVNPANTFNVRALGGVWFVTDTTGSGVPTAWCAMQPGSGAWGCTSSRDLKTDFAPADADDVLRKVMAMPVETWRFKGEEETIRHMGPMAQDFHAAFHLGHDPRAITTTDAAGVALAAIQGLYRLIEARDARIDALEREVETLRARDVRLHHP
jgi:hypothetical protein